MSQQERRTTADARRVGRLSVAALLGAQQAFALLHRRAFAQCRLVPCLVQAHPERGGDCRQANRPQQRRAAPFQFRDGRAFGGPLL